MGRNKNFYALSQTFVNSKLLLEHRYDYLRKEVGMLLTFILLMWNIW
jgi:hypothetical protein